MINQKKRLFRIIAGGIIFVAALLADTNNLVLNSALYLAAYLIVGGDVVWRALRNIARMQVFDENFLMFIATVGAFIIGEYPEAVGVMLFYQLGELFQDYAVDKSRKSIAELMNIRPDYANVKRKGEIITVDPDDVLIGEEIVIRPGERIPLDGVVVEGRSMVDTSSLTGEAVPREIMAGRDILSGCINISGLLTARVTKEFGDSTVSKILDLVENATAKKSKSENFITKFAKYYTPAVVILAAMLAFIPPFTFSEEPLTEWVFRALTFLVISCPCALVISVPLSFFGGIGGASRNGILVKGGNYLEALAKTEIVVFDKTGTLTKGVFEVQEIVAKKTSPGKLLELAVYAENHSNHPISLSLKKAYGKEIKNDLVQDVQEIPGLGVKAVIDDSVVLLGSAKLMSEHGITYDEEAMTGTTVHLAVNNEYYGHIIIADEIKEDAPKALKGLKQENIRQTVMLTGDCQYVGEYVAKELNIDRVYTELLPADKVNKLEEIIAGKQSKGKVAFVGDGVNDAPVLARADIGIAMGGLGSDAAIEAADVVIMNDEPSKIVTAIKIAKRTVMIAKQNIFFALSVKVVVLVLGALGLANMWAAVFADVGVSVIAILNAIRVLNTNSNLG
ncbi:MAG: cadmium-translocating P-type ATPase [Acholeplasmataceae bacterium]|nr:cadmium-translocating P-type ATPase [Acholeplasmataceae bacterium]